METKQKLAKNPDGTPRVISITGKFSNGLPKFSSDPKIRVATSSIFKDDGKRSLGHTSFILKNQTNPKFSFHSITPKPTTLTKDLKHAIVRVISERNMQDSNSPRESSMDPNQPKASAGYFTGHLQNNSTSRPMPPKKVALNKDLYINRKSIMGDHVRSKSKFKSSLQEIPAKITCNSTEKGLRNVINNYDKEKSPTLTIHLDRNPGGHLSPPDAMPLCTSLGEIEENNPGQSPWFDQKESTEKVKDTKQNVFDSIVKINQMWEADKLDPVMKN